jgi:hypothetical protein
MREERERENEEINVGGGGDEGTAPWSRQLTISHFEQLSQKYNLNHKNENNYFQDSLFEKHQRRATLTKVSQTRDKEGGIEGKSGFTISSLILPRSFQKDIIEIWEVWFQFIVLLSLLNGIELLTPTVWRIELTEIFSDNSMRRDALRVQTNHSCPFGMNSKIYIRIDFREF